MNINENKRIKWKIKAVYIQNYLYLSCVLPFTTINKCHEMELLGNLQICKNLICIFKNIGFKYTFIQLCLYINNMYFIMLQKNNMHVQTKLNKYVKTNIVEHANKMLYNINKKVRIRTKDWAAWNKHDLLFRNR